MPNRTPDAAPEREREPEPHPTAIVEHTPDGRVHVTVCPVGVALTTDTPTAPTTE